MDRECDVVIIGSGYGGSVMAARLASRARVLLVERGRHWRAGMFPETLRGVVGAYRSRSNPLGLWELRLGRGVGNGFASAFGGGSVVNYGVTMMPDGGTLSGWPVSWEELVPFYERVRGVLRPSVNPLASTFGDQQFIDLLEPGSRVDIENAIDWEVCTQCGHCVPGCNVEGAKRSLDRTYLRLARELGVEFLLETTAVDLERVGDRYLLRVASTENLRESFTVRARHVVVSAGTFGTLDLFFRWRRRFPLSSHFGRHMSMNGDGLAFLYNTSFRLSGHLGAPISTTSRLYFEVGGRRRILTIFGGRIPRSVMGISALLLAGVGCLFGRRYGGGRGFLRRQLRDIFLGPREGGALSQTYMYKLDGQDSGGGVARFLRSQKAVMDWEGYRFDPVMRFAQRRLRCWAERVGGVLVPELGCLPFLRNFGVHPLGGCRMGWEIGDGVVSADGEVFCPRGGVYPNLRVVDGSIVPSSLGVPPSMTIAALAERIAERMGKEL